MAWLISPFAFLIAIAVFCMISHARAIHPQAGNNGLERTEARTDAGIARGLKEAFRRAKNLTTKNPEPTDTGSGAASSVRLATLAGGAIPVGRPSMK